MCKKSDLVNLSVRRGGGAEGSRDREIHSHDRARAAGKAS